MKFFYKYLVVLCVILAACESGETLKPLDKGFDYFPLRVGFYQIYDVNEIRYSQVAAPETLVYELKVEVTDSFPNTAAGITYVIYRSTRPDANAAWQFMDTWSARRNDVEAVLTEGNVPYLKMIFPTKNEMIWDGNRLNNLAEDKYKTITFDETFTIAGTTFDKTLTVEQEKNDDPIVFTDLRTEVYARNAGLIYKETTQLYFCTSQNCNVNELIENGVIYKQALKEYGVR